MRFTAVLIGRSVRYQETAVCKDNKGHYIISQGLLNNEMVMLPLLYVPNDGQIIFLDEVFQKILLEKDCL